MTIWTDIITCYASDLGEKGSGTIRVSALVIEDMRRAKPDSAVWRKLAERVAYLERISWVLLYVRCRLAGRVKDDPGMGSLLRSAYDWARGVAQTCRQDDTIKPVLTCIASDAYGDVVARDWWVRAEVILLNEGASERATPDQLDGLVAMGRDIAARRDEAPRG